MTVALYPGSFDPVTNGHIDIAHRAARLFSKLIVGVYDLPQKKLLFSTAERADMMKKALKELPNVEVTSYSGLTVTYAQQIGAHLIVRGLRMSSDFEREFEMALMNKKLAPGIELVCFMTSLDYQFVSSSLLKEVAESGGCIDNYVPSFVARALKERLLLKCD